MGDLKSFGEAKANRSGDSSDWTPLECLEALVREIKEGKTDPAQLVVHYWEDADDGRFHHYFASNVTFSEHVALIEVGKQRCLEDWRR